MFLDQMAQKEIMRKGEGMFHLLLMQKVFFVFFFFSTKKSHRTRVQEPRLTWGVFLKGAQILKLILKVKIVSTLKSHWGTIFERWDGYIKFGGGGGEQL